MVQIQFFYRLDTLQIDAVYIDCKTNSSVFKDPATYMEVNVADPPYEVTRDHIVVLDGAGKVIGTAPSVNPVQPTSAPNPHQDAINALNDGFSGTGTPEKLNALKEAVLYLLSA